MACARQHTSVCRRKQIEIKQSAASSEWVEEMVENVMENAN